MITLGKPNIKKMESIKDIDGLRKALEYWKDADVRWNSVKALERLNCKPQDKLEKLLYTIAEKRWSYISYYGELAVPYLILVVKDKSLKHEGRDFKDLMDEIKKLRDPRFIDPLTTLLKSKKDAWDRIWIVDTIASIDDDRVLYTLFFALQDDDFRVREDAVRLLGRKENPQAVDYLISLLNKETEKVVIREAISVLGKLGDQKAISSIFNHINSDSETKVEIVSSLYKLRAIDLLISCLKNHDSVVRAHAARYLGSIREERAIIPLVNSLNDSYVSNRKFYAQALNHLKWRPSNDNLGAIYLFTMYQETLETRYLDALADLGALASDIVIDYLKYLLYDNPDWTDWQVDNYQINSAIGVLITIGSPSIEKVKSFERENDVRAKEIAKRVLDKINSE